VNGTIWVVALAILGAGFGAGILLLVLGLTPTEVTPRRSTTLVEDLRRLVVRVGRRTPLAVGLGLVVLVFTGWPVMAICAGALVYFWNALFGGAASERQAYARLEALAAWTESLRDTIAGAVGLEQAIPATAEVASPAIASAVRDLADHLRVRMPLPQALLRLAEQLDDPAADLVVAALLLNSKLRGPGLRDVLSSLSRSVRAEMEMRGRIMAGRRATRRSVQIVVAVSAIFVVGLRLFNPIYVEPYSTVSGQVVLVIVAAFFAVGFFWLRRLSAFEKPERFLQTQTPPLRADAGTLTGGTP
jgi:Flp pilus assembly protein TadB